MTCHFCETTDLVVLERNDYLYAIRDKFPVTELHTLLIPFRHVESYFDLDNAEIDAFNELLLSQKKKPVGTGQKYFWLQCWIQFWRGCWANSYALSYTPDSKTTWGYGKPVGRCMGSDPGTKRLFE